LFPIKNAAVKSTFRTYPARARKKLMILRKLILETAAGLEGVGEIEETLKWGEPAYLTSRSKTGSTIRLAWKKALPAEYRMLFNCRTNLVDTCFRNWHTTATGLLPNNSMMIYHFKNWLSVLSSR